MDMLRLYQHSRWREWDVEDRIHKITIRENTAKLMNNLGWNIMCSNSPPPPPPP